MEDLFPRTTVGVVSVPRMIMGINWLFGWSHTGIAADAGIKEKYQKPEDFLSVFKAYLDRGVDAIMGPLSNHPLFVIPIFASKIGFFFCFLCFYLLARISHGKRAVSRALVSALETALSFNKSIIQQR